jgi:hypothetical protein
MPKMNGTGPEGKGPKTGRGLGKCGRKMSQEELQEKTGKGMGKRRKSGGGEGRGKRSRFNQ